MVQLNINFSVFRGDLFLWQASLTTFDQEIFSQFELHTLNFFIKLCSICNNWTIFLFLLSKQKTFSGIIFSVNFFLLRIFIFAGLLQHLISQIAGLDKLTSSRPIFLASVVLLTCPIWLADKKACKTKVPVRSRNNRKHCFLFFII